MPGDDRALEHGRAIPTHYDAKGVDSVVAKLTDADHEYVPPTEVETSQEATTLHRADQSESIFEVLEKVPSYKVPTRRKVKQTRRLMQLARALVRDGIDEKAIDTAKDKVCDLLDARLSAKREDAEFRKPGRRQVIDFYWFTGL